MIIHPIPTHSLHQAVPALIASTATAVSRVIGGVELILKEAAEGNF